VGEFLEVVVEGKKTTEEKGADRERLWAALRAHNYINS